MVQSIPTQIRIDKNVENTWLEQIIEDVRKIHCFKNVKVFCNVDDYLKDMGYE